LGITIYVILGNKTVIQYHY